MYAPRLTLLTPNDLNAGRWRAAHDGYPTAVQLWVVRSIAGLGGRITVVDFKVHSSSGLKRRKYP